MGVQDQNRDHVRNIDSNPTNKARGQGLQVMFS